jgi:hypothetical protein
MSNPSLVSLFIGIFARVVLRESRRPGDGTFYCSGNGVEAG